MTEPNAEEREASDTDVKQRRAQMAYRARRVESHLRSGQRWRVRVAFQRGKDPTPDGVVGPHTWQMTPGLRA
jgi:hypothetical protein